MTLNFVFVSLFTNIYITLITADYWTHLQDDFFQRKTSTVNVFTLYELQGRESLLLFSS